MLHYVQINMKEKKNSKERQHTIIHKDLLFVFAATTPRRKGHPYMIETNVMTWHTSKYRTKKESDGFVPYSIFLFFFMHMRGARKPYLTNVNKIQANSRQQRT